jgi:hypothetical protein
MIEGCFAGSTPTTVNARSFNRTQTIAQDDDIARLGPIVIGLERTAERRRDAKRPEIVPAHAHSCEPLGLALLVQRGRPTADGDERVKTVAALAPVVNGRIAGVPGEAVAGLMADDDEPFGISERQRAEKDGMRDGEDCGVGANTERHRQHRHEGEAGIAAHQPRRVAAVLRQAPPGRRGRADPCGRCGVRERVSDEPQMLESWCRTTQATPRQLLEQIPNDRIRYWLRHRESKNPLR